MIQMTNFGSNTVLSQFKSHSVTGLTKDLHLCFNKCLKTDKIKMHTRVNVFVLHVKGILKMLISMLFLVGYLCLDVFVVGPWFPHVCCVLNSSILASINTFVLPKDVHVQKHLGSNQQDVSFAYQKSMVTVLFANGSRVNRNIVYLCSILFISTMNQYNKSKQDPC